MKRYLSYFRVTAKRMLSTEAYESVKRIHGMTSLCLIVMLSSLRSMSEEIVSHVFVFLNIRIPVSYPILQYTWPRHNMKECLTLLSCHANGYKSKVVQVKVALAYRDDFSWQLTRPNAMILRQVDDEFTSRQFSANSSIRVLNVADVHLRPATTCILPLLPSSAAAAAVADDAEEWRVKCRRRLSLIHARKVRAARQAITLPVICV